MRLKNCLLWLLVCSAFLSAEAEKNSIPWRENGFDSTKLLKKESYLPENFSINHLFSMGIVGFSDGTSRSGGTYLSLLRYDISPSLTLSAAIGFSMMFHSTLLENHPEPFQEKTMQPVLRIPYVALDYRISDEANFRLQIGNGSSWCENYMAHCRYSHRRTLRRPVIER